MSSVGEAVSVHTKIINLDHSLINFRKENKESHQQTTQWIYEYDRNGNRNIGKCTDLSYE
jgi:hypothetical protein